jgi:hypothetical protein
VSRVAARDRWTPERVDRAAPDDQVRKAGRRLAIPTPWRDVGHTGTLLFGRCQGSGSTPYQVSIDLAAPRYACSCPSRKFPCKHAIALLYLWADGHVDEQGVAADFAAAWSAAAERGARAAAPNAEAGGATTRAPADPAAAAQRAAERDARVDAGLADLDRYLHDLLSRGLAHDAVRRPERLAEQAARMVDAQAPGVAARLRALALVPDSAPDWHETLTAGLGEIHLLTRAWQHRADLPDDLVATVRAHLGFTVRAEDVLATAGVTDTWAVVGLRDADEERVSVRRVWLRGLATGRPALVLFFAAGGQALTSNLYPGTTVRATLHFYPGRPAVRAAVGEREDHARPLDAWPDGARPAWPALSIGQARRAWRDALAADPWIDVWPVGVRGTVRRGLDGPFALADADDVAPGDDFGPAPPLPLIGDRCWHVAAHTGGEPCTLLGELGEDGLRPSALVTDAGLVVL